MNKKQLAKLLIKHPEIKALYESREFDASTINKIVAEEIMREVEDADDSVLNLDPSLSDDEIRKQLNHQLYEKGQREGKDYSYSLLIDGNYFNPITYLDKMTNKIQSIPYVTVEGGDNKFASIAAASILAKVERDRYIHNLCEENPTLVEYYGIDSNKGYGAKRHIDGIKEHGITIWHRRSFGICKSFV